MKQFPYDCTLFEKHSPTLADRLDKTLFPIASPPVRQGYHLYLNKLLRLLNSAAGLALKKGSPLLQLDETLLLQCAKRQTGLDDFGDESFRKPLKILTESLNQDANLNFIGRVVVRHDLSRLLCNRLYLTQDRKRHPAIQEEVIRRPLFITGLPRSGSTFLHALLAQDPANHAPQVWEVMFPSPPPATASYGSERRIALTQAQLKWIDVLMPEFKRMHMIHAQLPQECIAITGHAFLSYVFESMYHVHAYRKWHDTQDKRLAYQFHKQFLQHLQWRCPGQRWLLKAPSHLLALDSLLSTYPDAAIILTHRDPLKVLPSCASFTMVLRGAFTDHIDPSELGLEISRRWKGGLQQLIEVRRQASVGQDRFCDVHYRDLVSDPLAVVRRIYEYFGLPLSDQVETRMRRFCGRNPQNKNGVHQYSLEQFGFSPEFERKRFQFYTDFFGVRS